MKWVTITLVLLIAALMLAPLFMTVSASLKGRAENLAAPLRVLPRRPTLQNYGLVFNFRSQSGDARRDVVSFTVGRWYLNTAFVAVVKAILTTVTGLIVAFVLSKYQFKGKRIVVGMIVLSLLIPGQVVFVQLFLVVRAVGLFNTLWALIVPGIFSAASVWFLMQYMKTIPQDFVDMGRVDGLGPLGVVRHVIAPMCVPAIGALLAMFFVGVWGEYLMPLVMVRKPNLYLLAQGIREVVVNDVIKNGALEANPGISFAGAVLAMLPGIVIFLLFQKRMTTGLFKGMK